MRASGGDRARRHYRRRCIATSRRSARSRRCWSTISPRSSCRTGRSIRATTRRRGEALDIVSAYQVAGHPDAEYRHHIACHSCPGIGSCGGMFTYIRCKHSSAWSACSPCTWWRPVRRSAPPGAVPGRTRRAPRQSDAKDIKPRDIVVRDSLRNAMIVAMAVGGSTNVTLHAPEIARAAGYADFWKDVMTPEGVQPPVAVRRAVLTDARPYGKYSMIDIDESRWRAGDRARTAGGWAAQRRRSHLHGRDACAAGTAPRRAKGRWPRDLSGREALQAHGRPARPRWQSVARVLGHSEAGGRRKPASRTMCSAARRASSRVSRASSTRSTRPPESFQDNDMVIVRYDGPSGAPGMPEMLDPTSRHHHALPRAQHRRRADDRCPLLRRFGRAS